jgi:DNA-directed RNA polymerase specialized sigma24 family protein
MHETSSGGSDPGKTSGDATRLLLRLDSDPARAGEKYEGIRRRLTKYFEWNYCKDPEQLADEVLDRVARKLESEEIRELVSYCLAVASWVKLEAYKKMSREGYLEDLPGGPSSVSDIHNPSEEVVNRLDEQRRLACLDGCLAALNPTDRELAVEYYSAEENAQIAHRRELARKLGVTVETLRTRVNRLRDRLEECVSHCLDSRGKRLI